MSEETKKTPQQEQPAAEPKTAEQAAPEAAAEQAAPAAEEKDGKKDGWFSKKTHELEAVRAKLGPDERQAVADGCRVRQLPQAHGPRG